jgi:adenylyltransferase/sulfurtransferase
MNSRKFLAQEAALGKHGRRLRSASACIVGLGGTGSFSSLLLAQMGVEKLFLIDFDLVEECNLSRQLYSEESIGKPKALEAKKFLESNFPGIEITAFFEPFSKASRKLPKCTAILDCTDNTKARGEISNFAARKKSPWIFSSAMGFEAMVSTMVPGGKTTKFWLDGGDSSELSCSEVGVMNFSCSLAASVQASEFAKIACGKKPFLSGKLFYADLLSGVFHIKKLG